MAQSASETQPTSEPTSELPWRIIDGPSRERLFDSFHPHTGPDGAPLRVPVTFTLEQADTVIGVVLIINNMAWEDGSGESWMIQGYALATIVNSKWLETFGSPNWSGYYSTKRRRGTMQPNTPFTI